MTALGAEKVSEIVLVTFLNTLIDKQCLRTVPDAVSDAVLETVLGTVRDVVPDTASTKYLLLPLPSCSGLQERNQPGTQVELNIWHT